MVRRSALKILSAHNSTINRLQEYETTKIRCTYPRMSGWLCGGILEWGHDPGWNNADSNYGRPHQFTDYRGQKLRSKDRA